MSEDRDAKLWDFKEEELKRLETDKNTLIEYRWGQTDLQSPASYLQPSGAMWTLFCLSPDST